VSGRLGPASRRWNRLLLVVSRVLVAVETAGRCGPKAFITPGRSREAMSEWCRRRVLRAATAATLPAVAGCNAAETDTNTPVSGPVDHSVLVVRNDSTDPVYQPPGGNGRPGSTFLADRAAVEDLGFPDRPASQRLAAFADDTDFDAQSLYLVPRRVADCQRLVVTDVSFDGREVGVEVCRRGRPADEDCEADQRVAACVAVRFDAPGDAVHGHGVSGGTCLSDDDSVGNVTRGGSE
jgi:hypothetical protein